MVIHSMGRKLYPWIKRTDPVSEIKYESVTFMHGFDITIITVQILIKRVRPC